MTRSPDRRHRALLSLAALALALCALALATTQPSCDQDASREELARAQRITTNAQLIGGPSARAELGDYLLENDHVRVIVQDIGYNRGNGVFGGSLIDADLIRPADERDLLGGNGRDTFGELFPAFFLEVVDPQQIVVLNDGSDGQAAVIEVRGVGGEFVSLTRLLNQVMVNSYDASQNIPRLINSPPKPPLLDQPPQMAFKVRYILEPGARHVRVENEIENITLKKLELPNSSILATLGALTGLALDDFAVPAGHIIGLGNLNAPFVPGIGYDIQFGLQDAYERPLSLPALPGHPAPILASSSDQGVSYGYILDASSRPDETLEERASKGTLRLRHRQQARRSRASALWRRDPTR